MEQKGDYMIRGTLVLLTRILAITVTGQMNFEDSSAQVISYWHLGDRFEYAVSLQKLKYTETDTLSNEMITYDVEVSVIDSTENSYIIRWVYQNFKSDSDNPIVEKLAALAEDIAVDIKTDEFGVIQSVKNWEEIRDYIAASLDSLRREFGGMPGIDKVFKQVQNMYSTKSAIEASAIQDVQQFLHFNGGKFILNETVAGQLKTANLYEVDKPFDTEITVTLEELDADKNEYVIRSIQEINSAQLTETTFNYLKRLTEELGQEFITREKFSELTNIVETVSGIHSTGGGLESVLWKEVIAEGITDMEIRRIDMK